MGDREFGVGWNNIIQMLMLLIAKESFNFFPKKTELFSN
jgi:hypothetical protein